MQLLSLARQDGAVDRLGQQRVAEPERPRGLVGHEHVVLDRPAQRLDEPRLGLRDDRGEEPVRDVAAGGRDDPQQRPGLAVEAGEPLQQHVAENGRKRLLAPFGGRDELLGEEGIALRALADLVGPLCGQRHLGDRDEEPRDLVPAERLQRERHGLPRPQELRDEASQGALRLDLVTAIGRHQQHPPLAGRVREEGHEIQRRPVGPVQVLEHEDERSIGADMLEHGERLLEEPKL